MVIVSIVFFVIFWPDDDDRVKFFRKIHLIYIQMEKFQIILFDLPRCLNHSRGCVNPHCRSRRNQICQLFCEDAVADQGLHIPPKSGVADSGLKIKPLGVFFQHQGAANREPAVVMQSKDFYAPNAVSAVNYANSLQ